ncbi:MAG: signal peptidase II [Bacilli bacterium]|nr:signal peptidase II [Bacilli bacterium]
MAKKKKYTEQEKKLALRQLLIFGAIAVVLFVIDIVSKWIVQLNCKPGELNEVIPNFFYITLSYNTGAAFSMGANWGIAGRVLGIIISVVLSGAILYYWIRHNIEFNNYERAVAALMSSGALGNLIDRAFYFEGTVGFNGVIDFFQFYLGGGPEKPSGMFNPFATFNFADACLVIGVVLFLIDMIIQMVMQGKDNELRKDPRLEKKASSPAKPVAPVTKVDENDDEEEEEEEEETWTPEEAAKMKSKKDEEEGE